MFIQTEITPNPSTLKFIPGEKVLDTGSVEFANKSEAKQSPLALRLFSVRGVKSVFFSTDFISIRKSDHEEWDGLKPLVLEAITGHYEAGESTLLAKADKNVDSSASKGKDSDIVLKIQDLINTKVRPAVAQDGGDITFEGFKDGVVSLKLKGACAGCPSSTATLKSGIENMLKHYIPAVKEVQSV
ncbi:MAG: NifU family protein [Rickettsiales bacterium]|nr:NifU family protein [Rickettsiales bacterium]